MANVAEIVIRAFDQTKPGFNSANKNFRDLIQVIADARTALAGLATGFGAGLMVREIVTASATAERFDNALKSVLGTSRAASREMGFLKDESKRLGLDLESTARSYVSLTAAAKGTSLAGQSVREIFQGVSEAATVLGLSSEQAEGALQAIQQMISKGTVQAEELRGQLGERLPGAFQIASRAMGVTTAELGKMLEQGQVIASDFLPKFAAELRKTFSDSAVKSSNSLTAEFNRLKTALFELKVAAGGTGITDLVKSVVVSATQLASSLAKSETALLTVASAAKVASAALVGLAGQMALTRVWTAGVALFGAQWIKSAADVRAAATLMATSTVSASATMTTALAGVAAGGWAVVEALRAIKAESQLKDSSEALAAQNDSLRKSVEAGIDFRVKSGSLSSADADKMRSEIAEAFKLDRLKLSQVAPPTSNFQTPQNAPQMDVRNTAREHAKLMEISRANLIPKSPESTPTPTGSDTIISKAELDKAAEFYARINEMHRDSTKTRLQQLFEERREKLIHLNNLKGDEEESAIARMQIFESYDRLIADEKAKIAEEEKKRAEDQMQREADIRSLMSQMQVEQLGEFDQMREMERLRFMERLAMIEEAGLAEDMARAAGLEAEKAYQSAMTSIAKQEARKRFEEQQQKLQMTASMLSSFASLAQAFGKKGFAAYKAFSIAEALISTYAGAARAFKDHPMPWSLVVAATVTAAGLARVAQIKSQNPVGSAHSGLDYVPETGTYVLKRGEAVLDVNSNKRWTALLSSVKARDLNGPEENSVISSRNQSPSVSAPLTINLGGEPIAELMFEMSRDGRLQIHERSITA